jgi:ferredoxin
VKPAAHRLTVAVVVLLGLLQPLRAEAFNEGQTATAVFIVLFFYYFGLPLLLLALVAVGVYVYIKNRKRSHRSSGALRLRVDAAQCNGCEECIYLAPELFAWDGRQEVAYPRTHKLAQDQREDALDAAETCPTGAIEVT